LQPELLPDSKNQRNVKPKFDGILFEEFSHLPAVLGVEKFDNKNVRKKFEKCGGIWG